MARRYRGVRHIKDDSYFLDYQVGKIRRQVRIRAVSMSEAKAIRQERIVELRKNKNTPYGERERLSADFKEALEKIEADLIADGVCKKNLLRNKRMFSRVFEEFRRERFPQIRHPSQLTIPFFQEYKSYFVNELGHNPKGGLRAEMICLKSLVRRMWRLGYCGKELVERLSEIKRPDGEKKAYPNIPNGRIRDFLNYVKNDRPDYYDAIYFMARVGRRVGEVLAIERRDVVFDGLRPVRIDVRAETTKSKTAAPLNKIDDEMAQAVMRAYKRGSAMKTAYLFCTKRGKKCSPSSLQKYLADTSERELGVRITPHYFRHRFITECGKARVNMADSMCVAGIKDLKVINEHYNHTTEAGQEEVLAVTRLG